MNDLKNRRWHKVIAGEGRVTVWKFSGQEVVFLGLSLVASFVAFAVLADRGQSFLVSLLIAFSIPLGMLVFLLTLVSGRPKGHAHDWFEWQCVKLLGRSFFESKHNTDIDDEN